MSDIHEFISRQKRETLADLSEGFSQSGLVIPLTTENEARLDRVQRCIAQAQTFIHAENYRFAEQALDRAWEILKGMKQL